MNASQFMSPEDANWLPVVGDYCRLVVASEVVGAVTLNIGLHAGKSLTFTITNDGSRLEVTCDALARCNARLVSFALALTISEHPTVAAQTEWSDKPDMFAYRVVKHVAAPATDPVWLAAVDAIWCTIKHGTPVHTRPLSTQLTYRSNADDQERNLTVRRGNTDGHFFTIELGGDEITAQNCGELTRQIEEIMVKEYVSTGMLVNFRPQRGFWDPGIGFQVCTQVVDGLYTTTRHPRYPA